jgi:2',3'-cyclic-nucleotide 2'-phosphodiesterase (5'-nucleotidase family)
MSPRNRRATPAALGLVLCLALAACNEDVTRPNGDSLREASSDAAARKVTYWLTLLHNNDGESELLEASQGTPDFGGVARFVTLVRTLREEANLRRPSCEEVSAEEHQCGGTIVVSSGDNFLAGPEFNASLTRGVPYFDAIALDRVGYDALAIGNHEFDFGPEVLADFIESFERGRIERFLSANLDFSGEPRLAALVADSRIRRARFVKRGGQEIGIVGATTPQLPFISSPRNVVANEVAPAVQREVDRLTDRGTKIIVLISHLQSVTEDLALIPLLRNVDIAVAGGGDELLANDDDLLIPGDVAVGSYPLEATDADGRTIPVVTTSGAYNYVGRLIAGFDEDGKLVRIRNESGPVRVAGGANPDAVPPDPRVESRVVEPVQASIEGLAANVIATSEVPLDGRRTEIRTVETNEGNLVADALLWQANELAAGFGVAPAQVGLQNGGGIRNDAIIPAGPFSELATFDILPFSNLVAIVPDISRELFKEILENAVSNVEAVDGRFAQIAGFSFTWDPAGTAQVLDETFAVVTPGTRIVDVTLDDGTAIVDDGAVVPGAALNIATIDFSARGGDQYPYRGAPFTSVGVSYQQALRNYIVDGLGGTITAGDYPEGGEGRIQRVPSSVTAGIAGRQ